MFQNHMLQLLSLVAMEPPVQFQTEHVRNRKAEVFKALRPFVLEISATISFSGNTRKALGGHLVSGYRQEPGVEPQSLTATFAG